MKDRILDLPMTVAVGVILCSPVSVFRKQKGFTFVVLGDTSTHLPGGKVDNTDSSINAAAIREVAEECGIDLDEAQLRTVEFWHQGRYHDKTKEVSRPFVIVYVSATLTEDQWEGLVNAEPEKHKELMKVMHTEDLGMTYHDNKAIEIAKEDYLTLHDLKPWYNERSRAEEQKKIDAVPNMKAPEEIHKYILDELEKQMPLLFTQVQGLRLKLIEQAIERKTVDILRSLQKNGLVGFNTYLVNLFENDQDNGTKKLIGKVFAAYTLETGPGARLHRDLEFFVEHTYRVGEQNENK